MTTTGSSQSRAFPGRKLFDTEELQAVQEVFAHAWEIDRDFGYQGKFEQRYCDAFAAFQGGGYCDGVSSGTAAVYLALMALGLPQGSDILFSPVTDPGGVNPIIAAGMRPIVVDSAPNQLNLDAERLEAAITPNSRAALITHTGGIPVDMPSVMKVAERHNLLVIEDCSQAHGATVQGEKVGTFGAISAFSTMFSKLHATGGCGGLVYTRDADLHRRALALADRGKEPNQPNFHPKDPNTFLFSAMNFNMDELSAAIGWSTLKKLPETLKRRRQLIERLPNSEAYRPLMRPKSHEIAPFFHTLLFDSQQDKQEVAAELLRRGVPINGDYRYLPSEWCWLRPYLGENTTTPNAVATRDRSLNVLFHERFSNDDMDWVASQLTESVEMFVAAK